MEVRQAVIQNTHRLRQALLRLRVEVAEHIKRASSFVTGRDGRGDSNDGSGGSSGGGGGGDGGSGGQWYVAHDLAHLQQNVQFSKPNSSLRLPSEK